MNEYKIAVVPGDGIGPEVTAGAVMALEAIGEKFKRKFIFSEVIAGGCAVDLFGEPLPKESFDACKRSDAVLLGAVGGKKWDSLTDRFRPENALFALRSGLGLYANIRPAFLYPQLRHACPLRLDAAEKGIDILIVRELTGGIYFGERGRKLTENGTSAYDTEIYNEKEIRRIATVAFEAAMKRKRKITSVDKANVLESSRLWRDVVSSVAKDYPGAALNHMYVDNAAMQLIRDPSQFDVMLTTNMFGDILSDEASQLTGSIGMLPSACLGDQSPGLFEPIHGSAPDIAGRDIANPIAAIFSCAMMLKHSFDLHDESRAVETAVLRVLDLGYGTADIFSQGMTLIGTEEMGSRIADEIRKGE